jgi:hypothetical protein
MSTLTETHWMGTLHLNLVRVLSATVTLAILYLLGRLTGILSGPGWAHLSILNVIVLPAGLLMVGLAGILVFRFAGSMGVPFMDACAGLMSLVMIVFVAVGDPLIWIVRKYYPAIVPVEQFGIINPHAVMMVQRV